MSGGKPREVLEGNIRSSHRSSSSNGIRGERGSERFSANDETGVDFMFGFARYVREKKRLSAHRGGIRTDVEFLLQFGGD